MGDFYNITLIAQAISSVLIGWLLLHFAKIYQRNYLFYWSYSFFSLTLYLIAVYFCFTMIALNYSVSSVPRLINLFCMSTAGYLQISFLVVGTVSLVNGTSISKKNIIRLLVLCLLIACFITLFKNSESDPKELRYLMRVGARYLVAGMACLGTAIYILRNDPNPLLGKKLVTIGFFVYGFEMAFLGWLAIENYIFDGSQLLLLLVPYHGIFELIFYPFIGVSLVMWLLDVERISSQRSSEKLKNLNQTDGLTGLPNQQAIHKHLMNWKQIASSHERLTLTLIGVDQMQRINDAEGIKRGDELIILLAKRLEFLCTGAHRFFGRLHGDVFVVVTGGYGKEQLTRAEKLRKSFSRPLKSESKTYYLEMSAGSTQLKPELSIETMLHQANQALQYAKQSGGKQLQTFHPELKLSLYADLSFENDLRTAFKLQQFEIYYQPIWSAENKIICFEALIRWKHPKRGLLTPDAFLNLIHDLGLAIELDYWVIDRAIQQVRKWKFINNEAAKISINVTAETIQNGQIVDHIKAALQREQIPANDVTIEITENTAMHNIESGKNTLNELKKMGIQVAIDDFGTGYSSLNYLRAFPSDVIKFDRSFVSDLNNQDINEEILKSLIPLCHRLNKKVVVEGVENRYQFDLLKKLSINGFQGFYLSYPVTVKEANKLLLMSKRSKNKAVFSG
ncbi:putative bifunctional diguanylate cyclase/phosphodiesterase [Marinicella litoralis]|uniref:Diguanylate cyclase (GGDEF)-like protein n=1 Tax=Marinicella litoralis TaxID=644220 RepID=A0A4R6XQU3_9GAMM|nr:GGDEF domain-containing phosphodiesterase [Marinicella litoralis]TDR20600.1 diguanylate cyclase (GGDEF)-like protein [Marinicella litoralis]